ncbi:MAG TPA: recombinase RecT, partial [Gemmatimonadaceae bacterium]|nr:recombinase RecT [Gemmatimonadaceae bacterium]
NPTVYLVPQAPRKGAPPELQWRITHRGLSILAQRAGFGILAVPVGRQDHVRVSFGEAIEHDAAPDSWPESLDDLQGCILVVRRLSDGVIIARPWLPLAAIRQRAAKGRGGDVWAEWGVEQAQKTVIKWGFARGYVPIDSLELRAALDADNRGEVIDVSPSVQTQGSSVDRVRAALAPPPIEIPTAPEPERVPVELDEEEQAAIRAAELAEAGGRG